MHLVLRRLSLVLAIAAPTLAAQDWPNWRGPAFDGSSPATGLPSRFDQETNVRWVVDMPGEGASTPIVVGDRVFLTSVDPGREKLVAICVDRDSGEVVWKRDAGSGYIPDGQGTPIAKGTRTTYASPSAVADDARVVFFFGNGDLVAYDFDGEELWRRNIQAEFGNFAFNWTFSASPTLWKGRLYLPVLQRDEPIQRRRGRPSDAAAGAAEPREPIPSFVLAIDPASGEDLFRHVRPSPARMESLEAYTTIIPFVGADGREELLLAGGDVLTAHDPGTGEELWRWGTWNAGHRQQWWRLVPSAVTGDGVALVCAPKRAPVYAIRLGGAGLLDDEALVWQSEGRPNLVSSDVPTPAYHDGHFYVVSDVRNALTKVVAKTGEVVWSQELPSDSLWRASPTVADGRVWFINHGGEVVVFDCESGELVHRAAMGEEDDDLIRSSIVAMQGAVLVRTNSKLFCLGE